MTNQQEKPVEILLVEDNPTDVLLAKKALAAAKIFNHLHVVGDGLEAMAFLCKQGQYIDAPRPNIILLDLNLPLKDGGQVLAELKADKDLRRIPVVVLSSSNQELDICRAYDLNANCYIVKPVNFRRFQDVLKAIDSFWFTIATLPSREEQA